MDNELEKEMEEEFKRQQDEQTWLEAQEEQEEQEEVENPYIELGLCENDFH